jgi:hypothetical protein
MVEGRQKIHQSKHRLVPGGQLNGPIHLVDGSHLSIIWGEGLLQIFGGVDSLSLQSGDFWGVASTREPSFLIN